MRPAAAEWSATPLPGGGWRVVVPGAAPSQNTLDREHWTRRRARVDEIAQALSLLRLSVGLRQPVFDRASVDVVACYASPRRRDAANTIGGLKQHVDALVRAGWLADDDTVHLRLSVPELRVERPPRVEFTLRPCEEEES